MLQHRLGALENLHSTLIQVRQAAQNIDVRHIISICATADMRLRAVDGNLACYSLTPFSAARKDRRLEAELAGLVEEREKDELRQLARVDGALPNVPSVLVRESGVEGPELVPLPLSSTNISSDGMSDTRSPNASETVLVMSQ